MKTPYVPKYNLTLFLKWPTCSKRQQRVEEASRRPPATLPWFIAFSLASRPALPGSSPGPGGHGGLGPRAVVVWWGQGPSLPPEGPRPLPGLLKAGCSQYRLTVASVGYTLPGFLSVPNRHTAMAGWAQVCGQQEE